METKLVEKLIAERDWAVLLARAAMDADVTWSAEYGVICIPQRPGVTKLPCAFNNYLPVERHDIRAALEAALEGQL